MIAEVISPPQTQAGLTGELSLGHKPGLGAEELTVTQPAEEGVVEAVPEKKHRLWAEG